MAVAAERVARVTGAASWPLDINCFNSVIKVIGTVYRYLWRYPSIS